MCGYSLSTASQVPCMQLLRRQLHPEDVPAVLASLAAIVQQKGAVHFQRDARREDAHDVTAIANGQDVALSVDRDCSEKSFHYWLKHALTAKGAKTALACVNFDDFAAQKAAPGTAERTAVAAASCATNEANRQKRRHILYNLLSDVTRGTLVA